MIENGQLLNYIGGKWQRSRAQYLFKLKRLLDEHFDEIARLTVDECGKTMDEARGELQRGIELYTEKKVVVERWPKEWSRQF